MSYYDKRVAFSNLIGKTIASVYRNSSEEEIIFKTTDGASYKMYHEQDCCESVYIDDINGDLQDLVGKVILEATKRSNSEDRDEESYDDSVTWTFYHIATIDTWITITWKGSSNGYYSESADFVQINNDEEKDN